MSTPREDPFDVLGIAPTVDRMVVKRAWFAALERHPPHADPAGFHRIRAAYEHLMRPGALTAALWSATFDAHRAFADLDASFGSRLAAATAADRRDRVVAARRVRFEAVLPWNGWLATVTALRDRGKP